MVSCNGNASDNDTVADTTCANVEVNEEHHCQASCQDSACNAANCENCTCPDSSACKQNHACKGEGNCCKKAESECCAKAEGCKKECEHKK